MAGSYLPLIGASNIVAVGDSLGTPMDRGTIGTTLSAGRQGHQKTQLLVALDNATPSSIPLTTAQLLFGVSIACPVGFAPPVNPLQTDFDYSKIFPRVSAEVLVAGFDVTAAAWPATMNDLFNELNGSPLPNVVNVVGRPSAQLGVTAQTPYGGFQFLFTGAAEVAAVPSPLILVTIDFGASASN